MKKLTIRQQIAKRDEEENSQPIRHGFRRKEHYRILGREVTKEEWALHMSTFGTAAYSGPAIAADGKLVTVKFGKIVP